MCLEWSMLLLTYCIHSYNNKLLQVLRIKLILVLLIDYICISIRGHQNALYIVNNDLRGKLHLIV